MHVARHGVIGKLGADPVADSVGGEGLSGGVGSRHRPHGDALEGLAILYAASMNLVDAGHGLEDLGDGLRVDVFAADDDHVIGAAHHVEEVVLVDVAQIADGNEPVHLIEPQVRVGIAGHRGGVGQVDFSHLAAQNRVALLIEDAQLRARGHAPGDGGVGGHLIHGGGRCERELGGSVHVAQDGAEALIGLLDHLRGQRVAGRGDEFQARGIELAGWVPLHQALKEDGGGNHAIEAVALDVVKHLLRVEYAAGDDGIAQAQCNIDAGPAPGVKNGGGEL